MTGRNAAGKANSFANFAPVGEQSPEQLAQARQQYVDNTTLSDGQRAFGGKSQELHSARLAAIKAGDGDIVERQLMRPEQRAAYAQDPLKAYEIDKSTEAANQTAQYRSLRDAISDSRYAATEGRQARNQERGAVDSKKNAAQRQIQTMFKDTDAAAIPAISAIVAQRIDEAGVAANESAILQGLLQEIMVDGSINMDKLLELDSGTSGTSDAAADPFVTDLS